MNCAFDLHDWEQYTLLGEVWRQCRRCPEVQVEVYDPAAKSMVWTRWDHPPVNPWCQVTGCKIDRSHGAGPGSVHTVVDTPPGAPSVTAAAPSSRPFSTLRASISSPDVAAAAPSSDKPTNPKDLIGSDKLPLHLWPSTATALGSLALLDGMLKYGRQNFRAVGVRYTIYLDAALRHLLADFEGEDADPDSGLPHLAHALACIAILVEARAAGNLNDDRAYPTRYREFIDRLAPHVKRLKAKHQDRAPRHYTINTKEDDA